MRHDFDRQTKEVMARRVAVRCSAPECGRFQAAMEDDAEESSALFSKYPANLAIGTEWCCEVLIPYRISRVDPKEV